MSGIDLVGALADAISRERKARQDSRPFAQVRQLQNYGETLFLWCPGCAADERNGTGLHQINRNWQWEWPTESLTVSPSILVSHPMPDLTLICHSFIRGGQWEFLPDSTHPLSGQTVPMVPLPEWLVKESK